MHPDLLNNSLFLRYYRQWQEDTTSIVFAPIAEYFLYYGMLEEATKICKEGIRIHPDIVSGHLVMAKIHIAQKNFDRARESIREILSIVPDNKAAMELEKRIDISSDEASKRDFVEARSKERQRSPSWETITMANIYSAQGHYDRAREIYESILGRDPSNEDAKRGLEYLSMQAG